ncbi:MAG: DsrE family protein [Burkholderiales bacterium]|jgi:uncharacterized protein involved in oxidation of intracellular sulfur|nr:DsrE family protein [Burkholderiales bacterium]
MAAKKILFIVQSAPYGDEKTLTALRLAVALTQQEPRPLLRFFFLSDGIVTALSGQETADRMNLGEILSEIINTGAETRVCQTCVIARGLSNAVWLPGVSIGKMPELAQWTLDADQVLTF